MLAVAVIVALVTGLAHSTGLLISAFGITALQVHVGRGAGRPGPRHRARPAATYPSAGDRLLVAGQCFAVVW